MLEFVFCFKFRVKIANGGSGVKTEKGAIHGLPCKIIKLEDRSLMCIKLFKLSSFCKEITPFRTLFAFLISP